MNNKPVIQMKKVSFSYPGNPQPTLVIESFEVPFGQKIFIYGPSGSGKTTFLEILSGILSPQVGSVQVDGVELMNLSSSERDELRAKKMGYIFQNFNLLPYLNVQENIELPARLRGESIKPDDSGKTLKTLVESLGIRELLGKPVTQLSVGQQQRVALARALVGRPTILLADEPTSSLDYDNREKFLQMVFSLSKELGTTVLFVSHDRSLEPLFDRSISFLELNQAKTKGEVR